MTRHKNTSSAGKAPDPLLDLAAFLPYRLSVLSNTVSGTIARHYAERFDLSMPEWRVMCILAMEKNVPASAIAQQTRMDKVQVSRAMARLDKKGLVTRTIDASDRRRQDLSMTDAGWAIYRDVAPVAAAVERHLFDSLSAPEQAQLTRLLARLQRAADNIPDQLVRSPGTATSR